MSIQRPTKCNICGGKVSYVPSSFIYGQGRSYGSGFAYWCRKCGAYVGTHKNSPRCAMGILADNEMRELRIRAHGLFDSKWSNSRERSAAYDKLAGLLGISYKHCHFSWFDKDRLREAIRILEEEWDDEDQ